MRRAVPYSSVIGIHSRLSIYKGRSLACSGGVVREYNGKFSDNNTTSSDAGGRGSSQKEQVDALLFPTNFAGYHDALVNLPHLQNRSRNMAPQYISAKRGGCARPATLCRVMKVVKARLQSDVASMNDVVPHNPFSRSLHRAVQKCLPTRASNEI